MNLLRKNLDDEKSKDELLYEKLANLIEEPQFFEFFEYKTRNKTVNFVKRIKNLKSNYEKEKRLREKRFNDEKLKIEKEFETGVQTEKRDVKDNEKINKKTEYCVKFRMIKNLKRKDVDQFFKPIKIKQCQMPWAGKSEDRNFVNVEFNSKSDRDKALLKNGNYILTNKIKLLSYENAPTILKKNSAADQNQNTCGEEEEKDFSVIF